MALPAHFATDMIYGQQGGGRLYKNRLYWTVQAGSITQTNITAVCDSLNAAFGPLYRAVLIPTWAFFVVNGYWNDGGGLALEGVSTDGSGPGQVADADDILPPEDNVVIRRRTGQSGRNKRGRIFITGIPESFTDDAELLTPGAVTTYKALGTKLDQDHIASGAGVTLRPVTPDFKHGALLPVTQSQIVVATRSRRDRRRVKEAIVQSIIGF